MGRITDSTALTTRIRELAATEPDPGVITEKILIEVDDSEARVIAALTLREHVRRAITYTPRGAVGAPRREASYTTKDGQQTPSPHVAGVRDNWVALKLLEVLQIGPRRYGYLRDATPAHLMWAVQSREEKAATTIAEAQRHQRAHDELVKLGLARVEELPDGVIIEIYRH
jgi:hypothetical protein